MKGNSRKIIKMFYSSFEIPIANIIMVVVVVVGVVVIVNVASVVIEIAVGIVVGVAVSIVFSGIFSVAIGVAIGVGIVDVIFVVAVTVIGAFDTNIIGVVATCHHHCSRCFCHCFCDTSYLLL